VPLKQEFSGSGFVIEVKFIGPEGNFSETGSNLNLNFKVEISRFKFMSYPVQSGIVFD
jgi:hypothetical protein